MYMFQNRNTTLVKILVLVGAWFSLPMVVWGVDVKEVFDFEPVYEENVLCLGGGGWCGGTGEASFVTKGKNHFAHAGNRAVCLAVWDNNQKQAIGWAGITRKIPCQGGEKVKAGAWFYASSTNGPLRDGLATAQIKMEFYSDQHAVFLETSMIYLSPLFSITNHKPDQWHYLEVCGRVPSKAQLVRIAVIFSGQEMKGVRQQVWVDDLGVELTNSRHMAKMTQPWP